MISRFYLKTRDDRYLYLWPVIGFGLTFDKNKATEFLERELLAIRIKMQGLDLSGHPVPISKKVKNDD